jgi:hypothetical protein
MQDDEALILDLMIFLHSKRTSPKSLVSYS